LKAGKAGNRDELMASTLARLMIVVSPLESIHQKNYLTRILLNIADLASINLGAESAFDV
jgi:hypothetical protein